MDWIEIAKTFGFPIAMCAVLMWWIYRREERETKTQIERETRMAARLDQLSDEVVDILRSVVNENTDSMRRMTHELKAMREHCTENVGAGSRAG